MPKQEHSVAPRDVEPPVNFSFCEFSSLAEAIDEDPRPSNKKSKKRGKDSKFTSTFLKFNNNFLPNIKGLSAFVANCFENPLSLTWIDFSFNEIVTVDAEILKFENLQILNFHGNAIQDVTEFDKLGALRQLKKFTSHGNPIEKIDNYRQIVLSKLSRELIELDFSTVTKSDRGLTDRYRRMADAVPKFSRPRNADDD